MWWFYYGGYATVLLLRALFFRACSMIYGVLIFLLYSLSMQGYEYVYPVGAITEQNILFFVHQKTANILLLYSYNWVTKEQEPVLFSAYTPASFTLLPDNSGFSFIDNDVICIQSFSRRSPKLLALSEFVYNFSQLHWIDADHFFCSAQKEGNFGIFLIDREGEVTELLHNTEVDYMYPQKIAQDLFCIARTFNRENNDASGQGYDYQLVKKDGTFPVYGTKEVAKMIDTAEVQILCNLGQNPPVFLYMESCSKAFFLCYFPYKDDQCIHFTYNVLFSDTILGYQVKSLFTFVLPFFFFAAESQQRLYESLLLFIPYHCNSLIYFSDYRAEKEKVGLYTYNLDSNLIYSCNTQDTDFVFCPRQFSSKIMVYGQNVDNDNGVERGDMRFSDNFFLT